MKKFKRFLAAVLLTGCLFSTTVSASPYIFTFVDFGGVNTRWTINARTHDQSPTVTPAANTFYTQFYLTKTYSGMDTKTQYKSIAPGITTMQYLLWNIGHTPSGDYYLLGMPDFNYGSWSAYTSSGQWTD